jgi:hypothetical protein
VQQSLAIVGQHGKELAKVALRQLPLPFHPAFTETRIWIFYNTKQSRGPVDGYGEGPGSFRARRQNQIAAAASRGQVRILQEEVEDKACRPETQGIRGVEGARFAGKRKSACRHARANASRWIKFRRYC